MASTLGAKNPFRYRGYYYDTETGYYYLNSRYYDPVTGRFLNAATTYKAVTPSDYQKYPTRISSDYLSYDTCF